MRRCDGRTPTFAVPFSEERSLDVKNERGSSADDPRGSVALACDHAFCADCVRQMCVLHVTEGTVGALRCPEPACGAALAPAAVRDALTGRSYDVSGAKAARTKKTRATVDETRSAGSLYERYEKLSLERGLDAMADLTYCPRCEHAVLEDEDGDHCAQCARCLYAFCSLCREGWHPGSACLNPERRLQVLESRARGGGRRRRRRGSQEAPRSRCGRDGASVRRARGQAVPHLRRGRGQERGVQQDAVRQLRRVLLLQVRRRRDRHEHSRGWQVLAVRRGGHRGVGARDERRAGRRGGARTRRARRGAGREPDAVPGVPTAKLQARGETTTSDAGRAASTTATRAGPSCAGGRTRARTTARGRGNAGSTRSTDFLRDESARASERV